MAHQDSQTKSEMGFVGAGRPRRPREIELIQQVVARKEAELEAVFSDGLVASRGLVVGTGPTAHLEMVPDHSHRLATAREILDRLHGKPGQTTTLETSTPLVNINLVTDHDLRNTAADLRRRLASDRAVEPGRADAGGRASLVASTAR